MQGLPLEVIEAHYFESMIRKQYLKVILRLRDSKEICFIKLICADVFRSGVES